MAGKAEKYGRLFTEADVQQIVNLARLEGSPVMVDEIVLDIEQRHLRQMTFPAGEPLFLLRGKDSLAPAAIDLYANLCHIAHADPKHTEGAQAAAAEVRIWQRMNAETTRTPD